MKACKSCSRVVLVLINVLFSLIGIVLLVVGCVVRWSTEIMNQYLSDVYSRFRDALEEVSSVNLKDLNIADLIQEVTLSFIIIGAIFFIIGIVGCIGGCCTVRPMLILYIVILTVLVLAEIAFVILLFAARSQVDEWLKTPFKSTLDEYKGVNSSDAVSLGLNFLMTEFDCCGVDGYGDFNESSRWDKTYVDGNQIKNKSIPAVCCKNVSDIDCWQNPTSENSYKDKGCYDAIEEWLNDNLTPLIGTSAGILALEIILVILACIACQKEGKEDDDDFDDMNDNNRPGHDAIRGYENQGYRGPHRNREPYHGYDQRADKRY